MSKELSSTNTEKMQFSKEIKNVVEYGTNKKTINEIKDNERTNDFRGIQAESLRLSNDDIQSFHNKSKEIDDSYRGILARAFRGQIDSNLGEKGFFMSIKDYVKEQGARTLDCYNSKIQPLTDIYAKTLGFKTASILEFNYDILVESKGKNYADYFGKTYGKSPVHFMVNIETEVIENDLIRISMMRQKTNQTKRKYP